MNLVLKFGVCVYVLSVLLFSSFSKAYTSTDALLKMSSDKISAESIVGTVSVENGILVFTSEDKSLVSPISPKHFDDFQSEDLPAKVRIFALISTGAHLFPGKGFSNGPKYLNIMELVFLDE